MKDIVKGKCRECDVVTSYYSRSENAWLCDTHCSKKIVAADFDLFFAKSESKTNKIKYPKIKHNPWGKRYFK